MHIQLNEWSSHSANVFIDTLEREQLLKVIFVNNVMRQLACKPMCLFHGIVDKDNDITCVHE